MLRAEEEWRKYGEVDPYFGVLAHEKFRKERLSPELKKEFFESGKRDVAQFVETVSRRFHKEFPVERVLEFGCGVGRLLIPFAKMAKEVVGLDVSEAMLKEAAANCREAGVSNAILMSSKDLEAIQGSFDLVYSYIVFQHIPPSVGLPIFARLVDLLREGGIGIFHFTYREKEAGMLRRVVSWLRHYVPIVKGVANVVRGRPYGYPLMRMFSYEMEEVFFVMQRRFEVEECYLEFTSHEGYLGCIIFFQKGGKAVTA